MSALAIRCERLAKQYRIGQREPYRALRDTLTDTVTAPFRRARAALHGGNGRASDGQPTVWAVKDISFDIRAGEVVGIIGRNGAGKSTLLKILSRITKPTLGSAEIYGRVGSLLEVGTGFHPELTGRENVYLNGAILGMRKAEIERKFDEIVSFAEINTFIDTPVKRYSSGMYMRLAFSVAAHLETEIMLLDEVLAVGDAQFQAKCLGKMGEVGKQGRTVLFVSHSLSAVQSLCRRGILLSEGRIVCDGSVDEVIDRYLAKQPASEFLAEPDPYKPTITRAAAQCRESGEIVVEMSFTSPFPLAPPVFGVTIADAGGVVVYGTNTRFEYNDNLPRSMQAGEVRLLIDAGPLRSGTYYLSLWLADHFQNHVELANVLTVEIGQGISEPLRPGRAHIGSIRLDTRWECNSRGSLLKAGPPALA
ncbi:MAG TPA: ABC transporter ATP-binding protein [Terriglobales bacterium]|nr:ABC transporter ATP-binding protein [Terriglobales bacterium]